MIKIYGHKIWKYLKIKYTISCILIHFNKERLVMVKNIIKRDGRVVEYNINKIENAVAKAMNAVGEKEYNEAKRIAQIVEKDLDAKFANKTPSVEQIPKVLILTEEVSAMLESEVLDWQMKGNYPLIVEIPGIHGHLQGHKSLSDSIREAVGISV